MKQQRIGIIQVWQESNDLNPLVTTIDDFKSFRFGVGADGLLAFSAGEEVGGFVNGLEAWARPADPVGLFMTQAWPGGPLSRSTQQWLLDEVQRQLEHAGALDGLLISLHGALVGQDNIDMDGCLLKRVRDVAGQQLRIVATIDLHTYLTPEMTHYADVIVAYHTNPHVDRFDTGRRAAGVLDRVLGGAEPTVGVMRMPMNTGGELTNTTGPVLAPVWERISQLEKNPQILAAAVLMAQPYLDVPDLGWSAIVYTDANQWKAHTLSIELADMCWRRRDELVRQDPLDGPAQSVKRALASDGKPVIIADGADSTNSGAPGDSVHLLKHLMAARIPDGALTVMVDPQAVDHARAAGEGGNFDFAVGGKCDHIHSQPMRVRGRVLFLRPVQFELAGHLGDKLPIDMGMGAAVQVNDVTLLLVDKTGPGSSPTLYRCVGLEPKDYKIVVVKSPAGFRAEYEPFAAGIILSSCPGCAPPDLTQIAYTRISRPVWPFDKIDDWRSVAWCTKNSWGRHATTQKDHHERAKRVLPGGVNSSTRVNQALGTPFYASRARGSQLWDIQDRQFLDMNCGHGAALLGHGHPAIDEAMRHVMRLGYANCYETEFHEELARKVCQHVPCAERVRFCSAGSEATLHMIRACRAYTGRDKILRVEGHFHGYHEMIYIGGHPPQEKLRQNRDHPYVESPGIPEAFADLIIPIPHNDPDALRQAIDRHGQTIAAAIIEPVNFNCACIVPQPGYLELMRELTRQAQIVLFFDEIQSVFKKSPGGCQADFGVMPDVCTIGKSLGGGLPLSAFCGSAAIMDLYQPVGPVQHSGTFNAHLVPILTGLAFMNEIEKPTFYAHLRDLEARFHAGMDRIIAEHDLNMVVPHHGSRFNVVLGRKDPPQRYEDTFCHDNQLMLDLIRGCWERGVYFHDYGGGPIHHGYSVAHTRENIDTALNVLEEVLVGLKDRIGAG